MTKVEEVARAITFSLWGDRDGMWQCYVSEARAAIAAMREPTEKMLLAAEHAEELGDAPAYKHWRAMIDAALEEKPG